MLLLLTVAASLSHFAECFTNYFITHTMPFQAQPVPSEQHNVNLPAYDAIASSSRMVKNFC
ncbi:hypothetical protein [Nostoc commune]|uniref:hypothetical protein n=1 Tax=Nostoc commune TaxID=1178 RepID=UPI0011B22162|nr:hypothetical protein [Nostoc commune]